jgi:hypothetical protein
MVMLYYPFAGIAAGGAAWIALQRIGMPLAVQLVVAIVAFILGMMAWSYTPLPDHNGGVLAGSENTGWGWGPDDKRGE